MSLRQKLQGIREEWRKPGPAAERVFHIAQRAAFSAGLSPALSLGRCLMVELDKPPKMIGGLSDLIIRKGEEKDVDAIAAVSPADPALTRRRLARGDTVYLGQLNDQIVCHTWFHRGPAPFEEERTQFALWRLDGETFWSYDAMTRAEARSSGAFVKVFVTALRELFESQGARRVRGFIDDNNQASLSVHKRLGFRIVGTVTAVAAAGMK